jgi:hypothetical protein
MGNPPALPGRLPEFDSSGSRLSICVVNRSRSTTGAQIHERLPEYIARTYNGKRRNFVGQHFWARGYWVSTVGHNEAAVRKYIQEQEKEDQRLDQLGLFGSESRFERLQD